MLNHNENEARTPIAEDHKGVEGEEEIEGLIALVHRLPESRRARIIDLDRGPIFLDKWNEIEGKKSEEQGGKQPGSHELHASKDATKRVRHGHGESQRGEHEESTRKSPMMGKKRLIS